MPVSNAKGKRGEREWAAVLRKHGVTARRGQQYEGSSDSPDVVHELGAIHFEVKRTEQLRLHEAMAQARDEAGPDELPVVVSRRNRGQWVAHLDAEALVELLAAAKWLQESASHASHCEIYRGGGSCDCGLRIHLEIASRAWKL